mgnify:CR=1 FL=1
MTLQLKYSASQEHQVEAIDAVCNLFRGQEFMDSDFVAEMGIGLHEGQVVQVGHANGLRLSGFQLERNLHAIQEGNALAPTSVPTDGRLRDFTVEMETGTGKTYCYIRTIYELNRRYGLTKFIIVVPSVAIREGVKKSFESTKSHFDLLYDKTPLECFVYDSSKMDRINGFAISSFIQVMIINIGAFDKDNDFDEDEIAESAGKRDKRNLFHRPSEDLIGGQIPANLWLLAIPSSSSMSRRALTLPPSVRKPSAA